MATSSQQAPVETEPMGCLGLVVRVTWLMAGNVVLLFVAYFIGEKGSFSALDAVFWCVSAGLVLVRYFDIVRLSGQTADGARATLWHWRRYAIRLAIFSAGLWGVAHAYGQLVR